MRKVICLEVSGEQVVGTSHIHDDGPPPRVGVLFLNAGHAPRSWSGDLGVRIAEKLAETGYAAYRFDMPGLGDSSGKLSKSIPSFQQKIDQGLYDNATLELARHVRQLHQLESVIIAGLCAGAVTAIRVAASSGDIDGLILFEPSVQVPPAPPEAKSDESEASTTNPRGRQLIRKLRRQTRSLIGRQKTDRIFDALRNAAHNVSSRLMGRSLPKILNTPLLELWKQSVSRRLPTLMVVVDEGPQDIYCRLILSTFPEEAVADGVSVVRISHTNHIFTTGSGMTHAVKAVEEWLPMHFSVVQPVDDATSEATSVSTSPA